MLVQLAKVVKQCAVLPQGLDTGDRDREEGSASSSAQNSETDKAQVTAVSFYLI